jgi:polysaccharide biosynthesis/export protein
MNELSDSASSTTIEYFDTPIRPNDVLSIRVTSLSTEDMAIINGGVMNNSANNNGNMGNFANGPAYMVDKDGFITMSYIGGVKLGGLSIPQAETMLAERFSRFTKNPVVNMRYQNHKVTVMGEVGMPREIPMQTERLTLLEAIALSGEMKLTGKRNNVMIIREVNGKRIFGSVDLTSALAFQSPFFYLRNNDVVYVEPVKAAYANRDSRGRNILSVATTLVGIGLSIFAISR